MLSLAEVTRSPGNRLHEFSLKNHAGSPSVRGNQSRIAADILFFCISAPSVMLHSWRPYEILRHVSEVNTTPLHAEHVALGGRMVDFAGYSLPVQYKSVIAESKAVREGAGMFDVSHMARLHFSGDRVIEFLDQITANSVSSLTNGTGQYSLLTNESGGCVDDIIVYRLGDEEFGMVVNAANHAKDVAHINAQNSFGVQIEDHTEQTAMIAVQGPKATAILAGLCSDADALNAQSMFGIIKAEFAGVEAFAARSGYTGEDGFELICSADEAAGLWKSLVEARVEPCGLGSRDVLRVEAGLPLYGHELSDDMSPLAAGLSWVIDEEKQFLGSDKIDEVRIHKNTPLLRGIKMSGRRIPPAGADVVVDGEKVGSVSSGVYSPMLECGIGFAFLDRKIKIGFDCEVEIRGKAESGKIVSRRFFKRA